MKISKQRIKEIIKEEFSALVEVELGTGTVIARRVRDPETGKIKMVPLEPTSAPAVQKPAPSSERDPYKVLRDTELRRTNRAYIQRLKDRGVPLTVAGTQNLGDEDEDPTLATIHDVPLEDLE